MSIEAITAATGAASDWAMPKVGDLGPDAQIEANAGPDATTAATGGSSFGDALTKAVGELDQTQTDAATQAQKLATGQTDDVNAVVMASERAQLTMQMATVLRDKSVSAIEDVLHTQV
jgi:flagellar hook-basal body complex protein FliE